MKETHQFDVLSANTAYIDYQNSLARYQRASQVAQAYREYRITKLEFQFMPLLDTFPYPDAVSDAIQVPYLYFMIDKTGTFSDFLTGEQLERAGAKPRRFDDNTVRINMKPSVLDYTYDKNNLTNAWARPLTSPWLSCDKNNDGTQAFAPSSIDHLGLAWIVDGAPVIKYQVRVTAHFQFRKPNSIIVNAVDENGEVKKPTQV